MWKVCKMLLSNYPGKYFEIYSLQLRKAVVDHVSDSFLETNVPLLVLIEAAKSGNEKEVEEYAQVFTEHANKLVEVSFYSKLILKVKQIFTFKSYRLN